jgi:hypothetical protein
MDPKILKKWEDPSFQTEMLFKPIDYDRIFLETKV